MQESDNDYMNNKNPNYHMKPKNIKIGQKLISKESIYIYKSLYKAGDSLSMAYSGTEFTVRAINKQSIGVEFIRNLKPEKGRIKSKDYDKLVLKEIDFSPKCKENGCIFRGRCRDNPNISCSIKYNHTRKQS